MVFLDWPTLRTRFCIAVAAVGYDVRYLSQLVRMCLWVKVSPLVGGRCQAVIHVRPRGRRYIDAAIMDSVPKGECYPSGIFHPLSRYWRGRIVAPGRDILELDPCYRLPIQVASGA